MIFKTDYIFNFGLYYLLWMCYVTFLLYFDVSIKFELWGSLQLGHKI